MGQGWTSHSRPQEFKLCRFCLKVKHSYSLDICYPSFYVSECSRYLQRASPNFNIWKSLHLLWTWVWTREFGKAIEDCASFIWRQKRRIWFLAPNYAAAGPTWVSNCRKPIQTSGCGDQFSKMGGLSTMSIYYSMLKTALLSVIELSPWYKTKLESNLS